MRATLTLDQRGLGLAGLGQGSLGPDLLHPESRPLDQGKALPLEGFLEIPARTHQDTCLKTPNRTRLETIAETCLETPAEPLRECNWWVVIR